MDTNIFRPTGTLEILDALLETQAKGVSYLRSILHEPFRIELEQELIRGPFGPATEKVDIVEQRFDRFAFRNNAEGFFSLESLRTGTERAIQRSFYDWKAKDILVQRYERDGYLTAHRDLNRHPDVVAIYTITGSCLFELLAGREGPVLESYQVYPGDLVLLRGSNRGDAAVDPRPFHRVNGSVSDRYRISVSFRDNLCPDKPIPGFSYRNRLTEGGE